MDCLRGGHCERESAIDNVSLSFQNLAVLHVVQSLSSDQNVLFLFVVLKISLFSLSFGHDLVIRMFHCLVITLKISLFSMSSCHDPVIRMFHCLVIILKISLFSMSSGHDPVIRMFHCLFIT